MKETTHCWYRHTTNRNWGLGVWSFTRNIAGKGTCHLKGKLTASRTKAVQTRSYLCKTCHWLKVSKVSWEW